MRLKAYILAADPAWIEESVLSYYNIVEEILVTYDKRGLGYTGSPVPVEECLGRLRGIDCDKKMRFCPGEYWRPGKGNPMDGEVYQRQRALAEAGDDADWVLQIDTDEVLPNPACLIEVLERAGRADLRLVEWPMRLFFQRLRDGRFLEVCESNRADHFEYPGPIAVRPFATPVNGRRVEGPFLRPVVRGDCRSLQVARPAEQNEHRIKACESSDAILHFSWVRTQEQIRSKIGSWAHSSGLKSWLFYHLYWKSAPYLWRWQRDFHPFARGLWPALKPASALFSEGAWINAHGS